MVAAVDWWSAPGVTLAWWAGVNGVELMAMLFEVLESVSLDKGKGIMWLWLDVHAKDVGESGAVVADCCPACPAKQIKQSQGSPPVGAG